MSYRIGLSKDKGSIKSKINPKQSHKIKDVFTWKTPTNAKRNTNGQDVRFTLMVDGKELDVTTAQKLNIKKSDGNIITADDFQKEKNITSDTTDIEFDIKFDRTGEFNGENKRDLDPTSDNTKWEQTKNIIKNSYNQLQKTSLIRPPKINNTTKDAYIERFDNEGNKKLDSNNKNFNIGKGVDIILEGDDAIEDDVDKNYDTKYQFGVDGHEKRPLKKPSEMVMYKVHGSSPYQFSIVPAPGQMAMTVMMDKPGNGVIDVQDTNAVIFRMNTTDYENHPFFITSENWDRSAMILNDIDVPEVRYYNTNPIKNKSFLKDNPKKNLSTLDKDSSGLLFSKTNIKDYIDVIPHNFIPMFDNKELTTFSGKYIKLTELKGSDASFNLTKTYDGTSEENYTNGQEKYLNENHVLHIKGSNVSNNDISGWIKNTRPGGAKMYAERFSEKLISEFDSNTKELEIDLSNNDMPIDLYDLDTNNEPYLVKQAKWSDLINTGDKIVRNYYLDKDKISTQTIMTEGNVLNKDSWGQVRHKDYNTTNLYFKNEPLQGHVINENLKKTGKDVNVLNDNHFIKGAIDEDDETNFNRNIKGYWTTTQEKYIYIVIWCSPHMKDKYKYHCKNHIAMTNDFEISNIPYFKNEFTEFRSRKINEDKIEEDDILLGSKKTHFSIKNPDRRYNLKIKTELKTDTLTDENHGTYLIGGNKQQGETWQQVKLDEGETSIQTLSFIDRKFDTVEELNKMKKTKELINMVDYSQNNQINDLKKRNLQRTRYGQLFSSLMIKAGGARKTGIENGKVYNFGTGTEIIDSVNDIDEEKLKNSDIELNKIFKKFKSGAGINTSLSKFTLEDNDGIAGAYNNTKENAKGIYEILDVKLDEIYDDTGSDASKNLRASALQPEGRKTKEKAKHHFKSRDPYKQFEEKFKFVTMKESTDAENDLTKIKTELDKDETKTEMKKAFSNMFKSFKKPQIMRDISGDGATKKTKSSAIFNLSQKDIKDTLSQIELSVIDKSKWGNVDPATNADISGKLVISNVNEHVKGLFVDITTDPIDLGISKSSTDNNLYENVKTKLGNPEMYLRIDKYDENGDMCGNHEIEYITTIPNFTASSIPKLFALGANKDPENPDNWHNIDPITTPAADFKGDARNIVRYIGGNQVYVKYYGSTTTAVGAEDETTQGTTGDPYVEPIYGPRYKLPDGNYNYRILDNTDVNNRFIINCNTWMLPDNEINKMQDFVYNVICSQFNLKTKNDAIEWVNKTPGIKMVSDACFIQNMYIENEGNKFMFDMENFKIVGEIPDNFNVEFCKNEVPETSIESYKQRVSNSCIKVSTKTKTYGLVTLTLLKFNNPQIRNGYKLETEYIISKANSRGAILFSQETKNITISSLTSNEIISSPQENVKIKYINEHFMQYYPGSNKRPINSIESIGTY